MAKAQDKSNKTNTPHATPGADRREAINKATEEANMGTPNPRGAENIDPLDKLEHRVEGDNVDTEETVNVSSPLASQVDTEGMSLQDKRDNNLPTGSTTSMSTTAKREQNLKTLQDAAKKTDQPGSTTRLTQEQAEQKQFATGLNFDMAELSEFYANLRDGNYWSAFKRAVNILHANLNADTRLRGGSALARGVVANRVQQPVDVSEVGQLGDKLDEWCENAKREHDTESQLRGKSTLVGASQEKNVKAIDFMALIALAQMIAQMVKKFRENRGS